MDIESDESESWEKFFGSSTDLAPSIIGYYDNLNNSQDCNDPQAIDDYFPRKSSKENLLISYEAPVDPNAQNEHSNISQLDDNLKILSPNLQRMLANTEASGPVANKLLFMRNHKQGSFIHKNKCTNHMVQIPLSKNTCKLSQSGELIEYVASSSNESIDLASEQEKTPTNSVNNNFDYSEPSACASVNSNKILQIDPALIDVRQKISLFTKIHRNHVYNPFRNTSKQQEANDFIENCDDSSNRATIVEIKNASKPLLLSPESPRLTRSDLFNDQSLDNSSLSSSKTSLTPSEVLTLKSRPLSASSICSSSSNSSSGSDHHSKLAASYLASIESLADHSECEHNSTSGTYTMCEKAVLEITDTERSYVEDLGQIIKGYLEDWKEQSCLKLDELKTLFSNIQEIYEFNSKLLTRLENSGTDPLKISKCFIDLHEEFNVYTVYCTSYPEAISLLTTLLQAKHTNSLLISTQKMLNHNLPLGSYLLKPVQRILKYHLLLDNLRKHCDFEQVVHAHELMKTVAHNIDQVKRKLDQQSRVRKLSGILDGWLGPDLTVLGELRQEDILLENSKPRVVFLFATMLIITKPKEDKRLQFKTYIPCKNLMLVEHLPGDPTSFNVLPFSDPKGQIKLTARNRDQKRLWAQLIKQAMLEHFDIPNRAKELVFKLGDEDERKTVVEILRETGELEDERATDKHSWKWNTHSSSTPEYLERRNQFRRSEIRTRSKKARKNLSSTLSLDGFSQKDVKRPTFTSYSSLDQPEASNHPISVETETDSQLEKTRSQSETRISGEFPKDSKSQKNSDEEITNKTTLVRRKSKEAVDVKSYNAKTIPKRIANIRKSRSKTLKETSTFYTDLQEDTTVLKITESTDNLHLDKDDNEKTSDNVPSVKRKDSEIISELILENKEFTKILNKPPKKKSFDSIKSFSSQLHEEKEANREVETELLEIINKKTEELMNQLNEHKNEEPEPIYESLLRNVHVPYKYAPALTRSVSQQYSKTVESVPKPKRPESDYVMLTYSEEGLVHIEESSFQVSQLRNSDSNINYNGKVGVEEEKHSSNQDTKSDIVTLSNENSKLLDRNGSFSIKSPKNYIQRLISMKGDDSNCDSIHKAVQRRISDVSEMAIYKQGSVDLGSRIANLDYADPRTLFTTSSTSINQNILINKNSVKTEIQERDSVFSLTSSNDSVCDPKSQKTDMDDNDSYYEKSVEECLENDFRDSAVYSGDDDRKLEHEEQLYESIQEIKAAAIPKSRPTSSNAPPIPVKPAHLEQRKVVIPPRIVHSGTSSRGWVLQQVQKFK